MQTLYCADVYLLTPWSRVLLEKLTGSAASQEIDVKLNIHELWVSLSSTSWRKAGALRVFQRTVMWKNLVTIPFTLKTF